jgi:hypothetical protein
VTTLSIPNLAAAQMWWWLGEQHQCALLHNIVVRNMVINHPFFTSTLTSTFIKTLSLFLGNKICLEKVLQLFRYLHII